MESCADGGSGLKKLLLGGRMAGVALSDPVWLEVVNWVSFVLIAVFQTRMGVQFWLNGHLADFGWLG